MWITMMMVKDRERESRQLKAETQSADPPREMPRFSKKSKFMLMIRTYVNAREN